MTAQPGPGTSDDPAQTSEGVSRRHALGLLGTAGAGAAVTPLLGAGTAQAAPALHLTADSSDWRCVFVGCHRPSRTFNATC